MKCDPAQFDPNPLYERRCDSEFEKLSQLQTVVTYLTGVYALQIGGIAFFFKNIKTFQSNVWRSVFYTIISDFGVFLFVGIIYLSLAFLRYQKYHPALPSEIEQKKEEWINYFKEQCPNKDVTELVRAELKKGYENTLIDSIETNAKAYARKTDFIHKSGLCLVIALLLEASVTIPFFFGK